MVYDPEWSFLPILVPIGDELLEGGECLHQNHRKLTRFNFWHDALS